MRFAIKTRPEHRRGRRCSTCGGRPTTSTLFESAWNFDHFYPIFSATAPARASRAGRCSPRMAQATQRIRLGCQVTGMVYRHPAVLANMAATVDIISDGRLELGLGAGWNQEESDAYGIALPPLKERFDRFDEGVEAIVGLLTQDDHHVRRRSTSQLDRRAVRAQAGAAPAPADHHRRQRPDAHAARGGAVRAAVERDHPDPGEWLEHQEVLAGRCAEIGRDPDEITCSVNVRIDPETGLEPVVAEATAYRDAGVDLVIVNLPHHAKPDSLRPLAEALSPLA